VHRRRDFCIGLLGLPLLNRVRAGFVALGLMAAAPENLPPVKLRAYGTLSGSFHKLEADGYAASVLLIRCESGEKAQLVQAKYLSDVGLLPGVRALSLATSRGQVPARAVEHGGFIAAASSGDSVFVLSAMKPP
jgi:hypothetical protein